MTFAGSGVEVRPRWGGDACKVLTNQGQPVLGREETAPIWSAAPGTGAGWRRPKPRSRPYPRPGSRQVEGKRLG